MCGIGVVTSLGVYLRLTGNIFVFGGAVRREGLKRRMPRPLVVVHSGRTTMLESGFSRTSVERGTRRAFGGGVRCGGSSARSIAWNREMRWTRRVKGYETVKMGSKIAAR